MPSQSWQFRTTSWGDMAMSFLRWLAIFHLVTCPIVLSTPAQEPRPKSFRAGAATSNITPPLGSSIIGGFVPFPATHVHDELHARCLVLDDGKIKLVLV